MGTYTELNIRCWLKGDMPKVVENVLLHINDRHKYCHCPDIGLYRELNHAFFMTRNWKDIMNGHSNYIPGKSHSEFYRRIYTNVYALVIHSNLKNYEHEYELFLHFIQPYIADYGFIGYLKLEEDDDPTLIYDTEDGIRLQTKERSVWLDDEWLAEIKDKMQQERDAREMSRRSFELESLIGGELIKKEGFRV